MIKEKIRKYVNRVDLLHNISLGFMWIWFGTLFFPTFYRIHEINIGLSLVIFSIVCLFEYLSNDTYERAKNILQERYGE